MYSLGYTEWTDGFNTENIPASIINESYHIETGTIIGGPANQRAHQFQFPVIMKVFLRGYNDPASAIDDALLRGDDILASVLAPTNRIAQAEDIKDISPGTISIEPLDATNDNSVVLTIEFNFNIYDCF